MSILINTNVPSLVAQTALSSSGKDLDRALQRLSTGLRINGASDDAAGLAIADRLRAQIGGLNQAVRNAGDGISLAQTAEGALQETTNILLRMRDLAVQAANDSNDASDRGKVQLEITQLQNELNRIATTTRFGSKLLLDGTFIDQNLQVGAFANETISISIASAGSNVIGNNAATSAGTINKAVLGGQVGQNNVDAQTLSVNGVNVSVGANATAKTIATSVNLQTGTTNVVASATTTAGLGNISHAGAVSFDLYSSNSSATTINAVVSDTSDLTSLVNAINGSSAQTGVTATFYDGQKNTIQLTSKSGDDIEIENYVNSGNANATFKFFGTGDGAGNAVTVTSGDANNGTVVVGGTVSFSSTSAFTLASGDANNTVIAAGSVSSTLKSIATVDLSTSAGAISALDIIDSALGQIADTRATLGAIQNRLNSTISNLSAVANNEAAAESRIRDADFAEETAALTRAQILQQAGVAVLSQANAIPQLALRLLQ